MWFLRKLDLLGYRASKIDTVLWKGWLVFGGGLLILGALHYYIGNRHSGLAGFHSWLLGRSGGDSWGAMRQAYAAFLEAPHQSIYQIVFFDQKIKFQYPPSSLLIFFLFDILGLELRDSLLNSIGRLSVLVNAAAVAALVLVVSKQVSWLCNRPWQLAAAAALAFFACMTFYPVVRAYNLGQVQAWLNAAFACACLAMALGRPRLTGALIGFICLFKPQFGLFLVWAALRRQWGFIAGWGLIVLSGEALALAVFGFSNHIDYLAVLRSLATYGESFYPNQSFNGLLNRLIGNGDNLQWQETSFPPYHPAVYFGTLVTSCILILTAMLLRLRQNAVDVIDLSIAGLIFTIASPIAWEHHYGVLPPAIAIVAVLWASAPQSGEKTMSGWLLVVAYLLSAHYFLVAGKLANTWANPLQSYLLLAALAVVWLLHRLRHVVPGRQVPTASG